MARIATVICSSFCLLLVAACALASDGRTLTLDEIANEPRSFKTDSPPDESGKFTFWFPPGANELVLPISAGVVVDTSSSDSMRWLRKGSPWPLAELPIMGLRYGDEMVAIFAPWPQYAEIVVEERTGIRFSMPKGRLDAAPVEIVAIRSNTNDPLEVARKFRQWRESSADIGSIPKPRPLRKKIADLPAAERLLGAAHFYLWGPALFSHHDIPKDKWLPFAKALESASPDSFGGQLKAQFSDEQRDELAQLASADAPSKLQTNSVALSINDVLSKRELLKLGPATPRQEILRQNRQALAREYAAFVNPPETWGDGASLPLVEALHDAGINRALLVLSDLYGRSVRPDVAEYADKCGYLFGPYDSYHSIHPPDAKPDQTWETAQFDKAAFDSGPVINADGSGHHGFMGRGFHFSPQVAWPYMKNRVGGILEQAPYSAWFVDCDATAECFEDYSPAHPATRVQDENLRRERLTWLESKHGMVVGSEGGSVLFADVIHFGHGVHTPFIIHLEPSFRDKNSQYYLGAHFPPDGPDQEFKPTLVPPSVMSPYFDPTMRIPLYQSAVGDEVVDTHHWSMDSLKFKDVGRIRELMEILYMVPPMYHLNRTSWPTRRDRIERHFSFWSPLHRVLAVTPLTRFNYLSDDRLVQRTTFQTDKGDVSIVVNFSDVAHDEYPAFSATVTGPIDVKERVYIARE